MKERAGDVKDHQAEYPENEQYNRDSPQHDSVPHQKALLMGRQ